MYDCTHAPPLPPIHTNIAAPIALQRAAHKVAVETYMSSLTVPALAALLTVPEPDSNLAHTGSSLRNAWLHTAHNAAAVVRRCGSSSTLDLNADVPLLSPLAAMCCPLDGRRDAPLPPLDDILGLLSDASEGTWLLNPRLLHAPHPAGCASSVVPCSASAASARRTGGSSSNSRRTSAGIDGVLSSVSSGQDVLYIIEAHGVTDASLSFVVERRIVAAYYQVSLHRSI